MTDFNAYSVGNPGDYVARNKVARFRQGIVRGNNGSAIKIYTLFNDPLGKKAREINDAGDFSHFLEFALSGIDPQIGFGFGIISEGMINVSMWGRDTPSVVHPSLFSWNEKCSEKGLGELTKLDIKREGAFCLWEARIAGIEGELWARYLRSPKSVRDKVEYLSTTIPDDLKLIT